ncbi:NnrS family protein [Gemmobacter lutimaris]|uniref:NnrS family protein n=1 Tax=Gemmobacter lutimaris TaxID=2306023 RepID=A0A398BTE0_9RHOB|nr:NnrS family protein [Gemmobacter lutimaris]RID90476.1 NnrS family protein [Gemmobacter lutimaris]
MSAVKRLFSEGFRVFFLSAGLFAVLAMVLWTGWLAFQAAGGLADLPVTMAPQHWHAHEMIFGYGGAALAGFFLTAVPNWTGGKAAPHRFIALAAGLWLAGRLALWFSGALPLPVVAVADLAFAPLLAVQLLMQLLRRPRGPQLLFVAMLALFWLSNLLVHLDWLGLTASAGQGLRGGLLVLAGMIVVMGGRLTPGFTRNAMVASGREDRLPVNPRPLAAGSVTAAIAVPVACLAGLPETLTGAVALLAGALALCRVALWRGGWTWRRPILWTLHLSYALNALGLVLLGLAGLGFGSEIAALHVLAIGGVGGMTLAVMSRASLGHSGRALVAPRGVVLAYALLPFAAALRWIGSAVPQVYEPAVLASGVLWVMAFTLYLAELWLVWWQPRLPRAPVGAPR